MNSNTDLIEAFSMTLFSMMIPGHLFSQHICQKSVQVSGKGPWKFIHEMDRSKKNFVETNIKVHNWNNT